MAAGDKAEGVTVVAVPFPMQGHLNPLLQLCRLLALRGFTVHFVSTAAHTRQARLRVQGWDPQALPGLVFHSFPVPAYACPPPDPHSRLPFPSHLQPSFESSLHIRPHLVRLLRSLAASSRRIVLLHDTLMPFAAHDAVAELPNAESFAFSVVSVFANLFFQWESRGVLASRSAALFPHLPVISVDGCFTPEFLDFIRKQHKVTNDVDAGRIFNTCRELEGRFMELIEAEPFLAGKKAFALGPLNPVDHHKPHHHECLRWLDAQPPASVVYVSFGTTSTLCCRQINELAAGLDRSKQRFIWVLRDADRGDIFAQAADGDAVEAQRKYKERKQSLDLMEKVVGGRRGFIVRGWAPQLDILGHPSTGAFLSHCGWNSCMESVSMGVPVLTWPIHSDQPRNALMLTNVLRVGIAVRDWSRHHELVPAATVESAIRRLMLSDEGKDVRARAKALGGATRASVQKGGSSNRDLEAFIAYIGKP